MSSYNNRVRFNANEDRVERSSTPPSDRVKPAGTPTGKKDFRKVLGRDKKHGEKDEEEELLEKLSPMDSFAKKVEGETGKKGRSKVLSFSDEDFEEDPKSLFELSKKSSPHAPVKKRGTSEVDPLTQNPKSVESPEIKEDSSKAAPLENKTEAQEDTPKVAFRDAKARTEQLEKKPVISTEEPQQIERPKKENVTVRYAEDRPDLAAVNPLGTQQLIPEVNPASTEIRVERPAVSDRVEMTEIANRLIEKMYTVQTQGKTETVVQLKGIPVFEGARIVVTSYDSAKQEFNISFENLTQQAQKILDDKQNQINLLSTLEQRGYNVHIITTTTLIETPSPIPEEGRQEREERQDKERREGEGQSESREQE